MLKDLEKVFKALSDQNRLRIIKMLQRKDMCVCEIREVLGLAQPTVSKHLKILKDAGIIIDQKEGLWTDYQLKTQNNYADKITLIMQNWLANESIVKADLLKAKKVRRGKVCL